jgi:hypothetical protein
MPPYDSPPTVMLTEVLALAPNVPVWAEVGALPVLQLAPVSKPVPVPPTQVWADAPTGDRQVPANKRAASRRGCRFTLIYAMPPNAPPTTATLRVQRYCEDNL